MRLRKALSSIVVLRGAALAVVRSHRQTILVLVRNVTLPLLFPRGARTDQQGRLLRGHGNVGGSVIIVYA